MYHGLLCAIFASGRFWVCFGVFFSYWQNCYWRTFHSSTLVQYASSYEVKVFSGAGAQRCCTTLTGHRGSCLQDGKPLASSPSPFPGSALTAEFHPFHDAGKKNPIPMFLWFLQPIVFSENLELIKVEKKPQ